MWKGRQFGDIATNNRERRPSEQPFSGGVPIMDNPILIQNDDAFGRELGDVRFISLNGREKLGVHGLPFEQGTSSIAEAIAASSCSSLTGLQNHSRAPSEKACVRVC